MNKQVNQDIAVLHNFVELLNSETDQILSDAAKRENKTKDQIMEDIIKNCNPDIEYGVHIDLKKRKL